MDLGDSPIFFTLFWDRWGIFSSDLQSRLLHFIFVIKQLNVFFIKMFTILYWDHCVQLKNVNRKHYLLWQVRYAAILRKRGVCCGHSDLTVKKLVSQWLNLRRFPINHLYYLCTDHWDPHRLLVQGSWVPSSAASAWLWRFGVCIEWPSSIPVHATLWPVSAMELPS